jgi:hypothetical protein
MRKSMVCMLLCSMLAAFPANASQVDKPGAQGVVHEGSIESVQGSPVALSQARYSMSPSRSKPGSVEVASSVKIESTCGKSITQLYLVFRYLEPSGEDLEIGAHIEQLPAGDVRDFVDSGLTSTGWTEPPALTS